MVGVMVSFIYRSVYEGPSGKLVRHFPDATVLDCFRRVWDEAGAGDAYEWVTRELGAEQCLRAVDRPGRGVPSR
jgi:hypothetical protein